MSQALVIFNYKEKKVSISCNTSEKMKNIYERFASGIQEDVNKLDFIYNGEIINKELKYEEQIDEIDRREYSMDIIVINRNNKNEEIICPEFNENEEKIDKENMNEIIGKIKIRKEDINKYIRIINSFEESQCDFGDDNNKYKNENEIKKCKIKINNK